MNNIMLNILTNILLDNYFCLENKATKDAYKKMINMKRRRLFLINYVINKRTKLRNIPKITNYMCVILNYPDDIFQSHFRMTRETFNVSFYRHYLIIETAINFFFQVFEN